MKHWKAESEAIKTVLDNGNASAQKMTTHGEVDKILAKQLISCCPLLGGQAVCCQREKMGGGGQGHQGVDHQDGGPRQDVGRPSR